jgi:hypothetical protein
MPVNVTVNGVPRLHWKGSADEIVRILDELPAVAIGEFGITSPDVLNQICLQTVADLSMDLDLPVDIVVGDGPKKRLPPDLIKFGLLRFILSIETLADRAVSHDIDFDIRPTEDGCDWNFEVQGLSSSWFRSLFR